MRYQGRCHCGAIGYSFATERPPAQWPVRACQCTFCRVHGAQTTSDPEGSVRFHATHAQALRTYRFGLRVTDFLLCGHCGVYIGATMKVGNTLLATVNIRALSARPSDLPQPMPADYADEPAEARRQRRARVWTPCVGIITESVPANPGR